MNRVGVLTHIKRVGVLTHIKRAGVLTESCASEASAGHVRTRTPQRALSNAKRPQEVSVLTKI